MTLEEIARILCEPTADHSALVRAVLLFGLQVATVSPTEPRIASDARLHAAMRILEYIETA